jgi:hypothetical protein
MIQILIIIGAVAVIALFVIFIKNFSAKQPDRSVELAAAREEQWGALNPEMICPHCQVKGQIKTKQVSLKKGVSGGKATAAILTGGITLIGGLSRKEDATQAHCGNCGTTWMIA